MDESTISSSPIDNRQYAIPASCSDLRRISEFLEGNKKPVVAIQGLGFVGSAMALVVAKSGNYKVLGVDVKNSASYWKIASLNAGIVPFSSSDKKAQAYLDEARQNNNILATFDSAAYGLADVIVVDINLDVVKKNGGNGDALTEYAPSMAPFEAALREIGRYCRSNCLVLVESTVPPGTCDLVVKTILTEEIERRSLPYELKIGHSYERVMPGPSYLDSIENFYRVYSGIDEESADATEAFLSTVIRTDQFPLTRLKSTRATEIAKVMENSYRAMNIAFIDEWRGLAENARVDLSEIIDAIKIRPTHSNIMRAGIGVGGYCLTKDPLLASWSSTEFFGGREMPCAKAAVEINDRMPESAFRFVASGLPSLQSKKILLLGVSYLGDVGDTRFSPVSPLYKRLKEAGADINLHDPFVVTWEEEKIPVDFSSLEGVDWGSYDAFVFCTNHSAYKNNPLLRSNLKNRLVFDLNYCFSKEDWRFLHSPTFKVLGNYSES